MKEFSFENDFDERSYTTEGFGFFKEKTESPWGAHTHQFVEIVYVLNGKADNWINEKLFQISRGDLLFMNYGSVHRFEPIGSFEYINVGLNPEILLKQINDKNAFPFILLTSFDEIKQNDEQVFSFYGEDRIKIECLFKLMILEAKKKGANHEFILESCLNILISMIVNKISQTINGKGVEDWEKLLEFIQENLGEKLSLNEIAKMCYYNPSYFSRLFKKKFGVSVSTYIKKKRIEEAKKMIENGAMIEEVVERLGFSSKHIFYSVFKEIENKTVGEFRNLLKKEKRTKVKK